MENQEFNKAILIEGNFDEQPAELVQALPKMLEGLMSSIGVKVNVGYASPTEVEVEEEAEGGCDPYKGCGECDECNTEEGDESVFNQSPGTLLKSLVVLANNVIEGDLIWIENVGDLADKYDPAEEGIGHPFFLFEGWKQKVAAGVTTDGYWDWVEECVSKYAASKLA